MRARAPKGPTRIAIGRLAVILIAGVGLATFAPRLAAQVRVNFGTGQYGAFREQLANMGLRADAILEALNSLNIPQFYCSAADKDADGQRLDQIRAQLDELQSDYNTAKSNTQRAAVSAAGAASFLNAGADPKNPNFWTNSDQEILAHPRADLDSTQRQWAHTKVIDCSQPSSTTPPDTTPPPPPPRKNPLEGLTRPEVPNVSVPAVPGPFCSEQERDAWIKANILPLLDQVRNASNSMRNYSDDLWDRLSNARWAKPSDSASVSSLQKELDWSIKEHERLDKLYWEIRAIIDRTTVIDCTQHQANPQPSPVVDSSPPPKPSPDTTPQPKATEPRTGSAPRGSTGFRNHGDWRLGGGMDYAYFGSFKSVAGNQQNISGFSGKEISLGWELFAEWVWDEFGVSISRHANTLNFEQIYNMTNPTMPQRISGNVNGTFYDANVGYRFHVRRTTFTVQGGATFAIDELIATPYYTSGSTQSSSVFSRSLTGWKSNFGLSIDYPFVRGFGGRVAGTRTSGGSGDADAHWRGEFLLFVTPRIFYER